MSFDIMNVEVEEPKKNFSDYNFTFYGVAGVGKSTLASLLFDDPAIFLFDNNQEHIRSKKIPTPDWKAIRNYAKTLVKANRAGKPMPFKTAIWDTSDVATKMCKDYVCKQNGWSHPSDGEWGAGWSAVEEEWDLTIKMFEDCGIKVVQICHDATSEVTRKDGTKYKQIRPNVGKTYMGMVVDKPNFVFYMEKDKEYDSDGNMIDETRYIRCRETTEYRAKAHLQYFPDSFKMKETPKETAEMVKKAFEEAIEKQFGKKTEEKPKKEKTKKEKKKEEKSPKKDKKEDKKPKKEEKKTEKPKTEKSEETLDSVLDKLNTKFNALYQEDKDRLKDLMGMIKEHTGKQKISDIDDLENGQALLISLEEKYK